MLHLHLPAISHGCASDFGTALKQDTGQHAMCAWTWDRPHRPELTKLPECEKLACRDVFPAHAGTRARKGSRASVHSAKITAGGSPASNAQKQTFCRDSSYSSTWAAPRHGALSPCRRLVECTCSPVALGRWTSGVEQKCLTRLLHSGLLCTGYRNPGKLLPTLATILSPRSVSERCMETSGDCGFWRL